VDLATLNYLAEYVELNRISRSRAIEYLIRMGRVYLQVLEDQGRDTNFIRNQTEAVLSVKDSKEKEVSAGDVV